MNKLTDLGHLRMAADKIRELIAQVAAAAVTAVESLDAAKADKNHSHTAEQVGAATIQEVNNAIASTGYASFVRVPAVPTAEDAKDNVLYLAMNSDTGHYDIYAKIYSDNLAAIYGLALADGAEKRIKVSPDDDTVNLSITVNNQTTVNDIIYKLDNSLLSACGYTFSLDEHTSEIIAFDSDGERVGITISADNIVLEPVASAEVVQLIGNAITMDQVNTAIDTAITGAINASY